MSLYKAMQNLKYDSRLTEFNLATGQITSEDWKKHLDKLPDMAHNIEALSMENNDLDDLEETQDPH